MNISNRQEQIFNYLVNGFSQQEIADNLFISTHTVKFHCRKLYKKLGVKNRVELLINEVEFRATETTKYATEPRIN